MSCEKSREAIINSYSSKEVDDCIYKLVRDDHRKDFKQELFLKLLEVPCDKVMVISSKGELRYYIVWVILGTKERCTESCTMIR